MVTFGHLGDGNLHYNVSPPIGMDEAAFLALQPALYACVHDQVARYHGSISAEHGIGQLKREETRALQVSRRIAADAGLEAHARPAGTDESG